MAPRRIVRAAAASDADAARAARNALAHGSAADAVAAGVLRAAALSPGVLLGPLQALVAGAGSGLLAIDGRVRQPGRGAPRPRGMVTTGEVPAAARVGVPAMAAAVAVLLAAAGRVTLRRLALEAAEVASEHAPARAALLRAIARRGAPAMADEACAAELVAVAGRAAGGTLTGKDLQRLRPAVVRVAEPSLEPAGWLRVPWRGSGADASRTQVVAAVDGRGMVCVACYEDVAEGIPVPALGLVAPAVAAPIRRGERRVRPGEPRPAAAPIALRVHRGLADLAVGIASTRDAEAALEALLGPLDASALVADVVSCSAGKPVAVARTPDAGTAIVAASA